MSNQSGKTLALHSQLNDYTQDAKVALVATKDNAIKVAAYCYMVMQGCKSTDGAKWLQSKVEAFNFLVQKHNAPIKDRQNDASAFNEGKAIPGHLAFEIAHSPEHKIEIDKAMAELELDAQQPDEYWTGLLQNEIGSIDGKKRIPTVVRVVLDLRDKKQAAQVSRYAGVVAWLDQELSDQVVALDDVIAKLTEVGGFEMAARQDAVATDGVSFSKDDRKAISAANEELLKTAVAQATPKGVVPMEAKNVFEGNVVLLGRTVEGGIAVVGEVAMGDGDIKRALRLFDHPNLLPANPTAEFLARVLDIGELVEETIDVETFADGSKKIKVTTERKVSLRPGHDGQPQLVVSTRYGDVSMVLHATPRADAINLGPVSEVLLLQRTYRQRLRSLVNDPVHRRFLEIEATDQPIRADKTKATSKLGWKVKNSALASVSSKNAEAWVYWSVPKETSQFPLDVMPLADEGHVHLSYQAVDEAYKNWIKGLKKADDKTKFSVAMLFSKEGLTLRERDPSNDYNLPVTGALKHGMHLKFAPKDIHAVFAMLLKQPAKSFEVHPDANGGVAISWMDQLGQYRLFVPTCRNDLSRTDRMLVQMRPVKLDQGDEVDDASIAMVAAAQEVIPSAEPVVI